MQVTTVNSCVHPPVVYKEKAVSKKVVFGISSLELTKNLYVQWDFKIKIWIMKIGISFFCRILQKDSKVDSVQLTRQLIKQP